MLAIVMIVLNGLVGTSLLFGGLRYHEQTYNLYGANAFLAVILPLSVLGLVLPRFTVSSPGLTLSPLQSVFLIFMSVALYGVFLAIQTMRHRDYFVSPSAAAATTDHQGADMHGRLEAQSVGYHSLLLLAAVEHQPDDPGGPHHRLHYGQNDHPRTRCRRYDLAVIDLGGEHADLRP
jgi:Ca2+:H+ antiporter